MSPPERRSGPCTETGAARTTASLTATGTVHHIVGAPAGWRTLDGSPPLTEAEVADLAAHEKIIEAGRDTFVQVGLALLAVRERKLYRCTHYTFAAYCADRWGISDRYSRRLMSAAKVAEQTGPVGPVSERVARELAPLHDDPDQLADVWAEAQALADGGTPTAKHVVAARKIAGLRTRAIEADHQSTGERIKKRAQAHREGRPDDALAMDALALTDVDQITRLLAHVVDLVRAGALDRKPENVRAEMIGIFRRWSEAATLAADLGEHPVTVTNEALGEWLDQPGEEE